MGTKIFGIPCKARRVSEASLSLYAYKPTGADIPHCLHDLRSQKVLMIDASTEPETVTKLPEDLSNWFSKDLSSVWWVGGTVSSHDGCIYCVSPPTLVVRACARTR